ncbi:MAG: germination protein YpeB [Clostridia bacterium]|nr:germination protein YpeB [Clostridia bacterium]
MNFKNSRFYIKTACFFAALAAVGAGFAYRSHLLQKEIDEQEKAYSYLTLADSAKNLEALSSTLSSLATCPEKLRPSLLSDVRLYSAQAEATLGHLDFESADSEMLFTYLHALSIISENALEMGIAQNPPEVSDNGFTAESAPTLELFAVLEGYAKKLVKNALPFLSDDIKAFEDQLSVIFSDTVLETILYENGYGTIVQKPSFSMLGGALIEKNEALKIARKHLGAKSQLKANLVRSASELYQLSGSNISAIVDARSGVLLQFLFDIAEKEANVTESEAKSRADIFLENIGIKSIEMTSSAAAHSGGLYIFEYIPYSKNNVLCLSEKIIVGVSHTSGRVCLYDATKYYLYHTKALVLPEKMLSVNDIKTQYGEEISPVLCKIERTEGIETLCYRLGTPNGEIFVNALSGKRINDYNY